MASRNKDSKCFIFCDTVFPLCKVSFFFMEKLIEEGRQEEKDQNNCWVRFVSCLCCGKRNKNCRIYWILVLMFVVGVALVMGLLSCNASTQCNLSWMWSLIFIVVLFIAGMTVCLFSCCSDGCSKTLCCGPLYDSQGGMVSLSPMPFKAASNVPTESVPLPHSTSNGGVSSRPTFEPKTFVVE